MLIYNLTDKNQQQVNLEIKNSGKSGKVLLNVSITWGNQGQRRHPTSNSVRQFSLISHLNKANTQHETSIVIKFEPPITADKRSDAARGEENGCDMK